MPTITYHRFWCYECQEFTLHFSDNCQTCGTPTPESYNLSDVPQDKIDIQRKRYTESKSSGLLYSLLHNNTSSMFDTFGSNDTIVETDAGQIEINEDRNKEREKHRQKIEEYKTIINDYKDVKRNDKCICGSDKKYKKCCFMRINELKKIVN